MRSLPPIWPNSAGGFASRSPRFVQQDREERRTVEDDHLRGSGRQATIVVQEVCRVRGIDPAVLRATSYGLATMARGYDSPREVWEALATEQDLEALELEIEQETKDLGGSDPELGPTWAERKLKTQGLVSAFEKLAALDGGESSVMSSHPGSKERAQRMQQRIDAAK